MGPAHFTPEKECYTVLFLQFFRKARPRPTAKTTRGRGTRALCAFSLCSLFLRAARARCRFLLKCRSSEEHSSRFPRGNEKVSLLRSGSLAPLQLSAHD